MGLHRRTVLGLVVVSSLAGLWFECPFRNAAFAQVPLGHGKIGDIAASRRPLIVRSIRGDEPWLANPGWSARQGVRAFVGYPLCDDDRVLGVMAVFDRAVPDDPTLAELAFLAKVAALRIVDLGERASLHAQVLAFEESRGSQKAHSQAQATSLPSGEPLVTRAELRAIEKQTIEAALGRTKGRVFGPAGAAALLAMKPTTLASRIKALKIR